MAKIKKWGSDYTGKIHQYYIFSCPGCGIEHNITSEIHAFNGDFDKPTLSPSVLYVNGTRCHSFIKDGKIQFLSDCDHALAGQTVELPDFE